MRRTWGVTSAALLLCGLAAAPAGAVDCPVDGTRLPPPPPRAWNAGGGVDSDGCTWSIASDGRRWVVGLDVLMCPRCGAAFAPDQVPALSSAQVEVVRRASSDGARPGSLLTQLRRAAELREAALGAGEARPRDRAELGTLFLRAAWAARQDAVLGGPDGDYRPRSITSARHQLEALEERVRRGGDQDPAVAQLEAASAELEALRRAVAAVEGRVSGADLVFVARARHLLGSVERRVDEARARLAAGAPLEAGAELILARGWVRFGDPARRERWLDAARARHGEAIAPEVARVREACAAEAALLRRAGACFAAAAPAHDPPERARLLFLAGDAARRAGDLDAARRLLAGCIEAEPEGRLAAPARALVER